MSTVEGWTIKPLSEIADITMGQSPDSKYYTEEEKGLPFIQGCAEFNARFPNAKLYCTQIKKIALKGSILFSVRALVGRINIANQAYIIGRGLAAISGKNVNQDFLEKYIAHQEPFFRVASQGSTFEAINTTELNKWLIHFPNNSAEQTKIAEILSCIDTAIEQTEAMIAKQQRIKTGLMQDLLSKGIDEHGNIRTEQTHAFKDSELGRIPVEWEVKTVGEVMNIIDPNPSHRYPETSGIGVPLVSTENFSGDSDYDLTFAERVPFELFEQQKRRFQFSPDDIIFARKGRIGLARLYGLEQKVFSHTVVIIKPKNNLMNTHFILWSVRAQRFFDEIEKRMNSNSGVPTLGVEFIKAIPTTMPEINEQLRIVDALNKTELQATHELKKLAKLKRQKNALMQDLLSGNVRVNGLI